MKRILVTGASGQLGRSIQEIAAGYPGMEFQFYDRAELDITRREQVLRVFQKYNPHYCVNCAAYTKVDLAEKHPEQARAVNVEGVRNLVEACRREDCVLVHISTDYVFDGTKAAGYLPDDTPNPINVYGRTKKAGEDLIKAGMERYFIIRTSWLYSRKYTPNFYLTILEKARKGENLVVTDSQRGCPTDAANLARHILALIGQDSTDYGISHFTDGEVMTWHGFASRILAEHGLEGRVELRKGENYVTFAVRPENSILR